MEQISNNPDDFDNGITQVFEEPKCRCSHYKRQHLIIGRLVGKLKNVNV